MDVKNKLIKQYIESSRFNIPERINKDKYLYKDILQGLLDGKTEIVTYKIQNYDCYTINKFPCIIPVPNSNKVYFVFDGYIERINKIFNTLFESQTAEELREYIKKLACGLSAENCLISNDKIGFVYSSLRANSIGLDFDNILVDNNLIELIQLYFIVMHEYSHFLFEQIKLTDDLSEIKDFMTDIQDQLLEIFSVEDDETITNIICNLKNDKSFVKECLCDSMAQSFIFKYLPITIDSYEKKLLSAKAILLQVLIIHMIFSANLEYEIEDVKEAEIKTHARLIMLKYQMYPYFSESEYNDLEKIFEDIGDINNSVGDIFFEELYNIQDEINNVKANQVAETIKYSKFTDLYTGL